MLWVALCAYAQRTDYTKLSPWLRSVILGRAHSQAMRAPSLSVPTPWLCAFVQVDAHGDSLLRSLGGESLARFGSIHIARMPLDAVPQLSLMPQVRRIEATLSRHVTLDTMAVVLRADRAYQGVGLPQAYTGRGVVVGVQDIGFDYTHPTFMDMLTHQCRIRAVWDMLAPDDGVMPVGAVFEGDEVMAQRHSADGCDQTHGTHTTGIAAGGGYESPYRGVAYESDICLVANATTDNASLIPEDRLYLYTYAMDALGFKYLFDYAESRGMPCVASFSEGSGQDFRGDDRLYYQVLDSLVGPGRILVASAGNDGLVKNYFHKPEGTLSAGSFVSPNGGRVSFLAKGNRAFSLRMVAYGSTNDTLTISSVRASADTLRITDWGGRQVTAYAYASAYNAADTVVDVRIDHIGAEPLSVELVGTDSDVSFYKNRGSLVTSDLNSQLCAGDYSHGIGSPASAPAAICVGSTAYRRDIYTYLGAHRVYDMGHDGERTYTSSIGPTVDERIKPDVMAPGTNVVSSYSSYYLEHHPSAWDIVNSDREHFVYQGRTYAWNYNSGTSMATPAVAGAIALWLQVCPTLTPADVRSLLQATCRRHDASMTYPNNYYGYGEIDAYAGLLHLLGLSAVEGLSSHHPHGVVVRPGEGGAELYFSSVVGRSFTVSVYAVGGMCVGRYQMTGGSDRYQVPMAQLPHGVYAVQVATGDSLTSGSQLVRY